MNYIYIYTWTLYIYIYRERGGWERGRENCRNLILKNYFHKKKLQKKQHQYYPQFPGQCFRFRYRFHAQLWSIDRSKKMNRKNNASNSPAIPPLIATVVYDARGKVTINLSLGEFVWWNHYITISGASLYVKIKPDWLDQTGPD